MHEFHFHKRTLAWPCPTHGLALNYGDTPVLRGVDLALTKGSTLALLGPSGCGKTTLLRLLAGLLTPTRGSVSIGGQVMADAESGRFVPPEKRGLGMVFQDYALWPHMSVARNVAFPLEMAGVSRGEITRRVDAALERVGLGGYAQRSPGDLSGGQQQRVAIARAIVGEPRLVLFDEPLSNLDRELREQLAVELAQLVTSLSLTAVYVTHDQGEAFTIADKVAVMHGGEIVQLDTPQMLVDAPNSAVVAEFLKLGSVLPADIACRWLVSAQYRYPPRRQRCVRRTCRPRAAGAQGAAAGSGVRSDHPGPCHRRRNFAAISTISRSRSAIRTTRFWCRPPARRVARPGKISGSPSIPKVFAGSRRCSVKQRKTSC